MLCKSAKLLYQNYKAYKVCRLKHVYCSFLTHILPVFEPKPELNRSDGRLTFLGSNPVTKLKKINEVVEKFSDKEEDVKKD